MNYEKEIFKLVQFFDNNRLPYTLENLWGGYKFAPVPQDWDAICHDFSYGHEEGLLEIMGSLVREDIGDEVEGWLTAEAVIERMGMSNG